jgi:hypothetical protein
VCSFLMTIRIIIHILHTVRFELHVKLGIYSAIISNNPNHEALSFSSLCYIPGLANLFELSAQILYSLYISIKFLRVPIGRLTSKIISWSLTVIVVNAGLIGRAV